jgi:hypothetical protein
MQLQQRMPSTAHVVVPSDGGLIPDDSLQQRQQRQQRQHQQQIRRLEQHQVRQRGSIDTKVNTLSEYHRFRLFIVVMLKIMEYFHEDAVIARANRIVHDCLQNKDPVKHGVESPLEKETREKLLQLQVTARLRAIVNELYWNLTRDYLGYSCD